jgi:hypothetical protein
VGAQRGDHLGQERIDGERLHGTGRVSFPG